MDPPAFGHGANDELWKIEEDFLNLVENCMKILADQPTFFLINGYSAGYSAVAYKNNLIDLEKKFGGKIEVGELTIEESGSKRLLPAGIFARWEK
jgi:23S rRNA (cytosine1962-C5)-methyltransferase